MKLPSTVVVGGVRYTVERAPLKPDEVTGLFGETIFHEARILVASELAPSVAWATYLHELGHAAARESGARDLLDELLPAAVAHRLEEKLCNTWLPVYRAALGVK